MFEYSRCYERRTRGVGEKGSERKRLYTAHVRRYMSYMSEYEYIRRIIYEKATS